jgi:non-homologous end joining protein Ku
MPALWNGMIGFGLVQGFDLAAEVTDLMAALKASMEATEQEPVAKRERGRSKRNR